MSLLGKDCVGEPYHDISELEEVFHHFSFSWMKLVNGKGEQGHHSQELPSGFLLPCFPLSSADYTYVVYLEQGVCPLSTSISSLL